MDSCGEDLWWLRILPLRKKRKSYGLGQVDLKEKKRTKKVIDLAPVLAVFSIKISKGFGDGAI